MSYVVYIYNNGEQILNELMKRIPEYAIEYVNLEEWILALDYEITLELIRKKKIKVKDLELLSEIANNPCKILYSEKLEIDIIGSEILGYLESVEDSLFPSLHIVLLCNCDYPKDIEKPITIFIDYVYLLIDKQFENILEELLEIDKEISKQYE